MATQPRKRAFWKNFGYSGVGRIGRRVSEIARICLGMKIVVFDPFVRKDTLPEWLELKDTMNEVLPISDFVTIHMPLNEGTRGNTGEEVFSKIKSTPFFLNKARASLGKEDELITTIEEGRNAGGAFDVLRIPAQTILSSVCRMSFFIL